MGLKWKTVMQIRGNKSMQLEENNGRSSYKTTTIFSAI